MASDDRAVFARAGGKQKVVARTIWTLHVGPLSFRCLVSKDGPGCEFQIRTSKGWQTTSSKGSALAMLKTLAGSDTIASAVAISVESAGGKS